MNSAARISPYPINSFSTNGNIIKAFVIPRDKANVLSQNNKLKESIKNLVKLKLAAHEYPRIIEFIKELPMTTTGKIIRKKLRENNK